MRKWLGSVILSGLICIFCSIAFADPPDYSWHIGNKATLGKDDRSWLKIYVGTDIIAEGSTDNGSETTLTFTDPTRDNTITFPDGIGTVALHNFVNIYFGSSSSQTLNTNQAQASVLRAYGTTAACTMTSSPSSGQIYILVNNNTGATATVTLKIPGGTGTVIAQGATAICYANGTNSDFVTAK